MFTIRITIVELTWPLGTSLLLDIKKGKVDNQDRNADSCWLTNQERFVFGLFDV